MACIIPVNADFIVSIAYLVIVCYLRNIKTNKLKQIILILATGMFSTVTASAQFFHRKNVSVEKQATPAKVKVSKEDKKVKVKKEEPPVVQEEMVPVNVPKARTKAHPMLIDTDWYLLDVSGNALDLHGGPSPYIHLDNKHRVLSGNTGCNTLGGKYTTDKHLEIKFEAATTRRACDNMSNENYLLGSLTDANRYEVNGENLLLYHYNMLLAIFETK
jgi:heat shock protein HslJ